MTIVMPMAGRGSRFAAVGIPQPKPLIPVRGEPMYAWAMKSLPLRLARRIVFICQREHLDAGLAADIRQRYGTDGVHVLPLDGVTEGQACTVLEARALIASDEPLIVYNADTYCRTDLESTLPRLSSDVDGVIGVFDAPGDKWSFARCDADGRVVETAEKRRISDLATTGLYHFSRGGDFVSYAGAMIAANDRVNGEFYVAPIYNHMIADGRHVVVDRAREVWVLGTPEDLQHFESSYPVETA
jgi:dTDP-glucose pyrophosphorylase